MVKESVSTEVFQIDNPYNIKYHEFSHIFPMQNKNELKVLVKSMEYNGFLKNKPIILYNDQVLDGRNRLLASQEAKILPWFTQYDGETPVEFVVATNRNFRSLKNDQMYIIAANAVTITSGEKASENDVNLKSAAKKYGLTERKLRTARTVVLSQVNLFIDAIRDGHVRLNDVAESGILKCSDGVQQDALVAVKDKEYTSLTAFVKKIPKDKASQKSDVSVMKAELAEVRNQLNIALANNKIMQEQIAKLIQQRNLQTSVETDSKISDNI